MTRDALTQGMHYVPCTTTSHTVTRNTKPANPGKQFRGRALQIEHSAQPNSPPHLKRKLGRRPGKTQCRTTIVHNRNTTTAQRYLRVIFSF